MWLLGTDWASISLKQGYTIPCLWRSGNVFPGDPEATPIVLYWLSQARPPFPQQCHSKTNPRDHASAKVRQSYVIAAPHGYKWIWNDTCCTDKSSSSDLLEAVNSTFRYSLAEACYAFPGDVPGDGTTSPSGKTDDIGGG